MKRAIIGSLVLIFAVMMGLLIEKYPVFLLINVGSSVFKVSFWLVLGVVFLVLWLFKCLQNFIGIFTGFIDVSKAWFKRRRLIFFYRDLNEGLLACSENNFVWAAKKIEKIKFPIEGRELQGLLLSKIHEQLGDYTKALDDIGYLTSLDAKLQVANIWLLKGEFLRAEQLLLDLRRNQGKSKKCFKLLVLVWKKLEKWEKLAEILPDLYRNKVFSVFDLELLENEVFKHLLLEHKETLEEFWKKLPRYLQKRAFLVGIYVEELLKNCRYQESETLLTKSLNNELDIGLLDLYTKIKSENSNLWFKRMEDWLRKSPKHVGLLNALGKASFEMGKYDKAQGYFSESMAVNPCRENGIALLELAISKEDVSEIESAFQRLKELSV